jgi:hypothetical protein
VAPSTLAQVFSGANQTGTSAVYGVGTSERYHQITASELVSRGLFRDISSCTILGSPNADPALILFELPGLVMPFFPSSYTGRFLQLSNLGSSPLNLDLASHGFDDQAVSALFVATNRDFEQRFSFRSLFLQKWKDTLDSFLSGPAHRKGDPILTWEMFPPNIGYLNPNRTYLKIRQDLDIVLDGWADYVAWIEYHIFLFINSAGNPRGVVQRAWYWIEGGSKTDDIEAVLKPAVIDGIDTLNSELTNALSGFDGFNLNDLYYLPGAQPSAGLAHQGFTTDDVTIVIEV